MNHDYSPEALLLGTEGATMRLSFCYACGVLRQRWSPVKRGAIDVFSFTTTHDEKAGGQARRQIPVYDESGDPQGLESRPASETSGEPACSPSAARATSRPRERRAAISSPASLELELGPHPLTRDEWREVCGISALLHVSKYDAPASVAKPYGPFPSSWRTWCGAPLVGVSWLTLGLLGEASAFERGDALCLACLDALPRRARPL